MIYCILATMDPPGNCKKFFINIFKRESNNETNNNMAHRYPLRSRTPKGSPIEEEAEDNLSVNNPNDDQSGSTVAEMPNNALIPENENISKTPIGCKFLNNDQNLVENDGNDLNNTSLTDSNVVGTTKYGITFCYTLH